MPDRTITQRNARYRKRLATDRNWRRVEVMVPADRADELRAFARRLAKKYVWRKAPGETVKLPFFGGPRIGRVGRPSMTDDGILEVASLEDLMATKLKVIMQRSEVMDYRDIAATIEHGIDLESLSVSEKKTLISAAAAVRDLPPVRRRSTRLSAGAEATMRS